MKNTKKLLSLFLIIVTILSSTIVFCVSATGLLDETDINVIETEDAVIEHELVPMMARGCTGTYIPSSWSIDESYRGSSIDYVLYMHGWTLCGNLIYSGNGVEIGRYHSGHLMDGQYTVAHFHIFSDIDNGYGNIHYIL